LLLEYRNSPSRHPISLQLHHASNIMKKGLLTELRAMTASRAITKRPFILVTIDYISNGVDVCTIWWWWEEANTECEVARGGELGKRETVPVLLFSFHSELLSWCVLRYYIILLQVVRTQLWIDVDRVARFLLSVFFSVVTVTLGRCLYERRCVTFIFLRHVGLGVHELQKKEHQGRQSLSDLIRPK
jgi:hypothetical protein